MEKQLCVMYPSTSGPSRMNIVL